MKCGSCKWYNVRHRREKGKVIPIQRLKTCHFNPPGDKGWPECQGEDMACREFGTKEPK